MKNNLPNDLKTLTSCRVCNNTNLKHIISLGNQHLVDFLEDTDEKNIVAPLELSLCNKIQGGSGLLQLQHTVPPDLLYRRFWYKSGVNQTIRNDLENIVRNAEKSFPLSDGDFVIDIGANDGTLLRFYENRSLNLIGFEPATNLMDDAKVGNTEIINNYFNSNDFIDKFGSKKAKIITSISMFYDLEKPNDFVHELSEILSDDGVWILQMNYLVAMLQNNAFDNIVHEHLEYYSLQSLEFLLSKHNLEVFDVEFNNINGGSIRTYIKHKAYKKFLTTNEVQEARKSEKNLGLDTEKPYLDFANSIKNQKTQTFDFIKNEVNNNKIIHVYGASTRGNTLLQYYGLTSDLIEAASERNPAKWGKRTVGTNIPIISEDESRKIKPDYYLILPWYFLDEFLEREKLFLSGNGKFIVPLPEFKIIQYSDMS